jgi:hypothetical protein
MWSLITFPFRLLFGTGKAGFKTAGTLFRFVFLLIRFIGKNSLVIAIGALIGFLLGRKDLRDRFFSGMKK